MKKIDFLDYITGVIDFLDHKQNEDFPALAICGKIIYFIPMLCLLILSLPLYVLQELAILIFTIFSELIQLLRTLTNSLFKLGDTK